MRDFYAPSQPVPLDQAHGLRQMFAANRQRVLPVAANPHVPFSGGVLDQMTAVLVARGHRVLVVDAADRSPAPPEMALIDLAQCIEPLSAQVGYLAGRGLPLAHVDTRGSASAFLDAIAEAAPQADAVLLHANATDLARMFMRRAARPMLIGSEDAESIKHTYAACKLLAQRCRLMTFDLLLSAEPGSRRAAEVASRLSSCADSFIGAVLHDWAVIDPASGPHDAPGASLDRLLAAQMALEAMPAPLPTRPAAARAHTN